MTRDTGIFEVEVNGATVFERLQKAFACPTIDPATGLAQTTEADRAVGLRFFATPRPIPASSMFASLLRLPRGGGTGRAGKALGHRERVASYEKIQATIRAKVVPTFATPNASAAGCAPPPG